MTFRILRALSVSILLLSSLAADTRMAPSTNPIPLTVVFHQSVLNFSTKEAQAVLDRGNQILSHGTHVTLSLKGEVGTFALGNGVANCNNLTELFKIPADVIVVREIDCCGKATPGPFAGCSGPGLPMIVLPAHQNDVQLRAVQWMHEFGHRKGLCHRTCPDGALMVPAPSIGNINIDPCESNILEGVTPNPACNACDIQTCDIPQQGGRISIADFVRQEFVEGIPYVPDIEYTAADIQYLDTLLNRPAEQAHWANAVVVLGMTGDRKAFELLKNFLERDIGPISPDADSAKLAVPIALGYLLAKTGNKEVFDYLRTGLDPTAWSDKVHWRASKGQRDDARDAHLTRLTILGLGLSGRREALRSLQSLLHQLSVRDAFPRKFKEGTGKYLREAIQINQHVRDVGLAQYYRDSETALFAARR